MRMLTAAVLVLTLLIAPAIAASPKVEAALKTIRAAAADPGRLKTLCSLMSAAEKLDEKENPAAEAEVEKISGQLGPEFAAAWELIDDLDENSPDGKEVDAALDDIGDKCT